MHPHPTPCVLVLVGALLLTSACAASPQRAVAPPSAPRTTVAGQPQQGQPQQGQPRQGQPPRSPAAPVARPTSTANPGDVARLRSDDFVERSHAADRLVAAGEQALPLLGQAGEGETQVHGTTAVSTTRPVVRSILSDLEQPRLYVHLDSAWPVIRREAAEELGRRGHWSAVPRLIGHLDDSDVDVRATSASSLRRLTNRFFGYDARAHLHARMEATERWRRWWAVAASVAANDEPRLGEG